jgi:hypothetical protein
MTTLDEQSVRRVIPEHAEVIIGYLRDGCVAVLDQMDYAEDPAFPHGTFVRDYWGSEVVEMRSEEIRVTRDDAWVATYRRKRSTSRDASEYEWDVTTPASRAAAAVHYAEMAEKWVQEKAQRAEAQRRLDNGLCVVCGLALSAPRRFFRLRSHSSCWLRVLFKTDYPHS